MIKEDKINKVINNKNSHFENQCSKFNCNKAGKYRAPSSREKIHDYLYFCLDHIREYNKEWNYYEGLDNSEIENAIRNATTWERPSWPTKKGLHRNWDKININFEDFDNLNEKERKQTFSRSFSISEIKAFKILQVSPTKNIDTIKKAYKKLVKKYHPDYNIGNKEYENKIKLINQAYNDLKEIIN